MKFTFSNNPISMLKCWYWNKKEDISQIIWQKGKRKRIQCRICGKVLDSWKEEYSPIQCGWHRVNKYSWICHMCFDHRNFRPFIEAIDEADRKCWEKMEEKSVLILESTPDSCVLCPLSHYNAYSRKYECRGRQLWKTIQDYDWQGDQIGKEDVRPDWCPLEPLPEENEEDI